MIGAFRGWCSLSLRLGTRGAAAALGALLAAAPFALAQLTSAEQPTDAATEPPAPAALADAVPTQALAALIYHGPAGADATNGPSTLGIAAHLVERARDFGLLDGLERETRTAADVVAGLGVTSRYPWAVVVMDATAGGLPDGGAYLSGMRGAVIVRTGGNNGAVAGFIQGLLDEYTDSQHSAVVRRPSDRDDGPSFQLVDARLPEWATLRWGAVGPFYVIALGQGTFDEVVNAVRGGVPALADDPFYQRSLRRCGGDNAWMEWLVRPADLRRRLAPAADKATGDVLAALGLADADAGLWVLGARGREVRLLSMVHSAGQDRFIPISAEEADERLLGREIPAEARTFIVFDHAVKRVVLRAIDTYMASRTESARQGLREMWRGVESRTGVNAERDLLDHLGGRIIIHDYPPAPIDLPIFRTVLIEIDGSADRVRASVDALLEEYRRFLAPAPDDPTSHGMLRRADDGVWYAQFGIYGPALTVTDGWLVLSYSPPAVRDVVRRLAPTDQSNNVNDPSPTP